MDFSLSNREAHVDMLSVHPEFVVGLSPDSRFVSTSSTRTDDSPRGELGSWTGIDSRLRGTSVYEESMPVQWHQHWEFFNSTSV